MTYHPIASAFPFISDLDIFKACVGDKEEIRHMTQANGCTVSSYIISSDSTFDNPYAIECRGLVFDQSGKLAARPLHKFFNLNEKPSTQAGSLDWSKVVRVMDKRDGSMIHTVGVAPQMSPFSDPIFNREGAAVDQDTMTWGYKFNTFTLKSKKSFESDVAVQARAWMATRQNFIDFCQEIVAGDKTAIFEWTSPTARIVLPYREDELKLLHVRDNGTGRYMTHDALKTLSKVYDVMLVDHVNEFFQPEFNVDLMLQAAESREGVEGWVVQFADGNMVKVKTKWYMERHRAMTFLRERDIVGMVLHESIDDLKALLVGEGVDISEICALEEETVRSIRALEHELDTVYSEAKSMSKKDAALKFGPAGEKFALFSLLMNKMDGREPDVKGWYERNFLPKVSLRQLNLLNTVAEAE